MFRLECPYCLYSYITIFTLNIGHHNFLSYLQFIFHFTTYLLIYVKTAGHVASSVDPNQTPPSDLDLHYLLRMSVQILRESTVDCICVDHD